MSKSNFDFTVKFFRPPQRTVSSHNGLFDTRTKHIVAQDRLIVAEQRILDAERRKSATTLQVLAFEQKKIEKKRLSSQHNLDQSSIQNRHRSASEINLHRSSSWNNNNNTTEMNHSNLTASLHNSNQNLLSLPKNDDFQRRFSASSDEDVSGNPVLNNGTETDKERDNSKTKTKKAIQPPIVAIISPEEDILFIK